MNLAFVLTCWRGVKELDRVRGRRIILSVGEESCELLLSNKDWNEHTSRVRFNRIVKESSIRRIKEIGERGRY